MHSVSEGGNVWDDITGVAGDIATFVTSASQDLFASSSVSGN